MRIAVTGATGFIGGVVTRHLTTLGHEVIACGRRPASALRTPLPRYVQWDVREGPATLPGVEAVVHCAARVGQWGSYADYHRVNVDGLRTVLSSCPESSRFIHISSASVYAHGQGDRPLTEDALIGESHYTAYARSKAAAERELLSSGRRVIVLRPHVVYGPGDRHLLPRVLRARRFGFLPVPGDGRQPISVTYVGNLAHAVALALQAQDARGIFNVADDVLPTVDELFSTLLPRLGFRVRVVHVPVSVARSLAGVTEAVWHAMRIPAEPRLTRYAVASVAEPCTLDLTRIREQLHYQARWSFRDAPMADDTA